jgi:hypothetical protein
LLFIKKMSDIYLYLASSVAVSIQLEAFPSLDTKISGLESGFVDFQDKHSVNKQFNGII